MSNEGVSGRGGVCGRETPSGGNTGILAFADHLHAQKPILHTTGKGYTQKHKRAHFSFKSTT